MVFACLLAAPARERARWSKVIHAKGEFEAAQTLADVVERIEGHRAAMHLRILSTMAEISGSEIPLPAHGSQAVPVPHGPDGDALRDRVRVPRTQVIGMNPSMDDRRVLAEMERRLSQDDPELVGLMDALNHQFPDAQADRDAFEDADAHDEAGAHEVDDLRLDWRWKAIVVFAVVLVAGLILTAVFNRSASTDDKQGPLNSRAPAVAVDTHGRGIPGPGEHPGTADRGAGGGRLRRRRARCCPAETPSEGLSHGRTCQTCIGSPSCCLPDTCQRK
ncbi:hypothetical protein [Streptomyces cahuitamycinicus]|uniref:Uncharacterized protein n=1 Tax=Streptomyces cahuitamycinicus TaxID=2070367 RepID=A0A2N8TY72_9ACTN|nr:hypothetical protein [Streptomyces cahuitamycinicus]PNG23983.1 hypothetical protein C1J00_00770 [Streptomyces cahuitamycinicus]